MHECKGCRTQKPRTEFYSSNKSRCKECVKKSVRTNRNEKADYYREYDRQRFQDDPRVLQRHIRYQATDAGKLSMAKAKQKWLKQNPVRRAAHIILGNAVRDKRIKKPTQCSRCDGGGRIHGHHEDYAKPLDVIWLCSKCHRKAHE